MVSSKVLGIAAGSLTVVGCDSGSGDVTP